MQIDNWLILHFTKVTSTMDKGKQYIKQYGMHPFAVVALEQTDGRGRKNRKWYSAPNNIYLTLVLPLKNIEQAALFSYVTSLAVFDCVNKILPPKYSIGLKWPNDILVDGQKISGILIEVVRQHLLIGIGVNLNTTPVNNFPYPVTNLQSLLNRPIDNNLFLIELIRHFNHWESVLYNEGFMQLKQKWLQNRYQPKQLIKIKSAADIVYEGAFADISDSGALLIKLKDQDIIKQFYTGEILLSILTIFFIKLTIC